MDGSWRETEDERIVIDRKLVDLKCIRVKCIGGSLDEGKLSRIKLLLHVKQPGSDQIRHEKEIVISAGDDEKDEITWEFLIGDPPVHIIHYKGVFVTEDGFVTENRWKSTNADLLVVHVSRQAVNG